MKKTLILLTVISLLMSLFGIQAIAATTKPATTSTSKPETMQIKTLYVNGKKLSITKATASQFKLITTTKNGKKTYQVLIPEKTAYSLNIPATSKTSKKSYDLAKLKTATVYVDKNKKMVRVIYHHILNVTFKAKPIVKMPSTQQTVVVPNQTNGNGQTVVIDPNVSQDETGGENNVVVQEESDGTNFYEFGYKLEKPLPIVLEPSKGLKYTLKKLTISKGNTAFTQKLFNGEIDPYINNRMSIYQPDKNMFLVQTEFELENTSGAEMTLEGSRVALGIIDYLGVLYSISYGSQFDKNDNLIINNTENLGYTILEKGQKIQAKEYYYIYGDQKELNRMDNLVFQLGKSHNSELYAKYVTIPIVEIQ